MSNLEIEFKEFKQIRNTVIKGLAFEYLPAIFIGASKYLFEIMPGIEAPLILLSSLSFLYGYILCLKASIQYARYKRYPDYFGLLGILNIFGLSFLFFLDKKDRTNYIF